MRGWSQDNLPLYVRLQHHGKRKWIRVGSLHVNKYASHGFKDGEPSGVPMGTEHVITSNRAIGAAFEPDLLQVLSENGVDFLSRDGHVFHFEKPQRYTFGGDLVEPGRWFADSPPPSVDQWFSSS